MSKGNTKKRSSSGSASERRKSGSRKADVRKKRIRGRIDYIYLTILIVMVCAGLIMLLSASAPASNVKHGNSYTFFLKQLGFAVAGFVGMFFVSRIDYRKYKKYTGIFMIICVIMLILVFVPGIGARHNGASRWINLRVFEFQPSEFMKLAIAMFFAAAIETNKFRMDKFKELMFYVGWLGVTVFLLMRETHLSGTIIIAGIAGIVMLVGGLKMKWAAIGTGIVIPAGLLYLFTDETRMARVKSAFDPFADMQVTGYQVVQGLYAIGTGGLFGLGLGQSVQKYSYLPEPYNDFIFAIICEELGFVGAVFIMTMFVLLIIRGIKIALKAPDVFGMLTVVGIMAQIGLQTLLNIAVVTGLIPNTGVTLPFFSYGGTALTVLLVEMGIVLNVSRYSEGA